MTNARLHIGRRLLHNKGTLFGLIVIALSLVVALCAYFIAPDPSPNANRIIVEIGGRRPGFQQLFLLLPKERPASRVSFFDRLLNGREDAFDYIPINSYVVKDDSLIVQKFVDEDVEERRAYAIAGLPPNNVSPPRSHPSAPPDTPGNPSNRDPDNPGNKASPPHSGTMVPITLSQTSIK